MTDARRQTCLHLKLATLPKIWWTWPGSNRRPLPCHGSALPAAPQAHSCGKADARKAGTSSIFYYPLGLVKLAHCVLTIHGVRMQFDCLVSTANHFGEIIGRGKRIRTSDPYYDVVFMWIFSTPLIGRGSSCCSSCGHICNLESPSARRVEKTLVSQSRTVSRKDTSFPHWDLSPIPTVPSNL